MSNASNKEQAKKDQAWLFRTYSGHSSAKASNELYRTNLKRGQTGLSVAFDLPTQTGYDSDHVLAKGSRITRVGQKHPDLPLEIHVDPPFDPQAVYDELKLAEPVFVSERNVLYCKEDWCELHPEKK